LTQKTTEREIYHKSVVVPNLYKTLAIAEMVLEIGEHLEKQLQANPLDYCFLQIECWLEDLPLIGKVIQLIDKLKENKNDE